MTMEVRTTDLDRYKGMSVVYGNNELLTLAPGQTSEAGALVIAGSPSDLEKMTSADLRSEPRGGLQITLGARRPLAIGVSFKAIGYGTVLVYAGKDPIASVTIGEHRSHLNTRSVDLLARTSNGQDCRKVVAIQRILQGRPHPIIDQFEPPYGGPGQLACGTVVQRAGGALFGRVDHSGKSYHRPIARRDGQMSFADVQYDPMVTEIAIGKIRALLDRGTAVRLGMVYNPGWGLLAPNGAIQAERSGGHTILVVGYSETQFLYLDPFAGGSKVRYRGGLPFNMGKTCEYMGVLEVVPARGRHLATVVDEDRVGDFGAMEVISGPLH